MHLCFIFEDITLNSEQRGNLKKINNMRKNIEKEKQLKDILLKKKQLKSLHFFFLLLHYLSAQINTIKL